jgi:hypothetical protein
MSAADWFLEVSPPADDQRWHPHHIRPGERVEIVDRRTGATRVDYVATANPRFLAFPDGLAFEQPRLIDTEDGTVLRPGQEILAGAVPRFTLRRSPR